MLHIAQSLEPDRAESEDESLQPAIALTWLLPTQATTSLAAGLLTLLFKDGTHGAKYLPTPQHAARQTTAHGETITPANVLSRFARGKSDRKKKKKKQAAEFEGCSRAI